MCACVEGVVVVVCFPHLPEELAPITIIYTLGFFYFTPSISVLYIEH